jgi:D-alanyl-lipoteichoic acid acyltransferase DltB (MBOAT superfamily)
LIVLLIASTILDFYVGHAIWNAKEQSKKKLLLIISLVGNLGLLGFFKYADFAILQFNILGNSINLNDEIPLLNLALPIGISFYTFQTISYTVDIYRGKLEPSKSFKEFALFVAFFSQLVAGPIVRAKDFLPQLREKIAEKNIGDKLRQITIKEKALKMGVTIMAIGFLKKMFFADNIAPFVNEIFQNPIGHESFTIILATIAFGLQIYGDFSGYSDIAIGAALILGFKLPINFNKPYFATSPTDFWRRWHISLSSWLRDYLYIPIGGNRKSSVRTYVNLAIVMFLGGLWHGASWNFVVWGLLHGAYLAIHKIIKDKTSFWIHPIFNKRIIKLISIFITQYFVFLAWIPFRVRDIDGMLYSMHKYIFLDFQTNGTLEIILGRHKSTILIMIVFVILLIVSYKKKNLIDILSELSLKKWIFFLAVIMSVIFFSYVGYEQDFIYFQF